jgi:hypothetical protein
MEYDDEEGSETKEVDEWNGASSRISANTTLLKNAEAESYATPAWST